MPPAPPKVAILSIGDMGMGIAKLLVAHGFTVATNCAGRSQATVDRAAAAHVSIVPTDAELVRQCDIVFSVVPPKDAMETATRVFEATKGVDRQSPLYFADMNAVAPSTCKEIKKLFEGGTTAETKDAPAAEDTTASTTSPAPSSSSPTIRLIDGCILGGPPKEELPPTDDDGPASSSWYRPLMPTSGPYSLDDVFPSLADTMNSRHIGPAIGAASGLKMCFASMTKGYSAIAIQAFTTAHKLGVLDDLKWAMQEIVPSRVKQTEGALTSMAPKAYRWVREMEEISDTFRQEAGFEPDLFRGAAGVFRSVAEDSVLGAERIGQRKRGRTSEDVAAAMAQGLDQAAAAAEASGKKQKTE